MAKKVGCPKGQERYGGRCVPFGGTIKLNGSQADVLYTNLYLLVKNSRVIIRPSDNLEARQMFGKTELSILNDVKKKVDKIRP